MAIPVYPLSVRKAALRAHADGVPYRDITRMYKVSAPTLMNWSKATGVKRKTPITDEQLDACIEKTADTVRRAQEIAERSGVAVVTEERRKKTDHKFGPPKPADLPKPILDPLKGPTTIEQYEKMIANCLEHASANLARDTTVEGQAKHLMTGILFKQLQTLLHTPPTVGTGSDEDRIFNQVKDLLGMNEKKAAARRIDINILSQKIEKAEPVKRKGGPRVFEAEVIHQEEPVDFDLDNFEV
jgi:hypothetical protein